MNMFSDYTLAVPLNENDHTTGNSNAKISLVEYGDYQCPYCRKAYPIVKQLQEDFGDSLQFTFRNFPLSQMHQYAFGAAEAAEIAGDYSKFWPMNDLIYENQSNIDPVSLLGYASSLGIDEAEFLRKLKNNDKAQKVQDDFMSGVESGVNGTPSFFINGNKYEGSWEYFEFKQVLASLV